MRDAFAAFAFLAPPMVSAISRALRAFHVDDAAAYDAERIELEESA